MFSSKILTGCIIIFLTFSSLQVIAQKSRAQLEKEKKENLSKIIEAQKILQETELEKQTSLGQLRALNQQIKARQALIESITAEIRFLDEDISDLTIVSNALNKDLEALKAEYADMIYSSYKSSSGVSKLTFLFSSGTFNQLTRRMKYLEQYAQARKTTAKEIEIVSAELQRQRDEVVQKKEEQDKLLNEQLKENKKLISLKSKQSKLIAKLSGKEKQLKKELDDRKKLVAKFDQMIADIVKAEMERTRAEAPGVASVSVSTLFEENKKKLDWPVEKGFVSMKFGKHPHPVLKGQYEENMGVNIQTNKNELVKAVFDGEVSVVRYIPRMNYVVIIKHGEYFTTYTNLKTKNVERGQKVAANDVIGEVYTDNQGVSEFQFQIWKNKEKLDPEQWLTPR